MTLPVPSSRLRSIDLLRGIIMVIMVIDHVRVYSGQPPGGPEPGIFFTRWVTHFCAPVFAFLAGSAAYFHGLKTNLRQLSVFLLTRGSMLVVLELTVVRLGWTFNLRLDQFMLAGIIWMLGWSMIIMAALVRLKPAAVGITGLAVIIFQDVFKLVPRMAPDSIRGAFARYWEIIYPSGSNGPDWIWVLFSVVPWVGVMAAGYGFGIVFRMEPAKRRQVCLVIGITAITIFLAAGSVMTILQPGSANTWPFLFKLLNQRKYPASQLYLCMTLGPAIALIPLAEKAKGRLAEALITIGSVPLFYYILHIPLHHVSAFVVNLLRSGRTGQEWYHVAPFTDVPPAFKWPLWCIYAVFAVNVVMLYFACRWYANYKRMHPKQKWMRYI
ncbi:DUF1624 domain-containing protein [Hufsiella ginkgonis]|uniref:DUF1624 domain-containing protein n=1 Tax=Hufsiella ginkgonis TaxID=2695274 RepID=A0A7K1Y2K3_9SPHI|nr:heparan-alpha-glucosaminide N-acetyltransferase domain-containing protein [Hufsiella ginkgonis]MXV17239.1 DUF1624 domain-containing protein [Hufsiella ginkgonis]